jgi:hypothetical protein
VRPRAVDDLARERFVGGQLEERGEMLGAHFAEAALQLLLLAPDRELVLKLTLVWRSLLGGFVDRDRFVQTPARCGWRPGRQIRRLGRAHSNRVCHVILST